VLAPGETGRFGWMPAAGDQANANLRREGTLFLWEGQVIGEARIVG
jgi:hypothetical protein